MHWLNLKVRLHQSVSNVYWTALGLLLKYTSVTFNHPFQILIVYFDQNRAIKYHFTIGFNDW